MVEKKYRKVKTGKAKNYEVDAKIYDYYFITVDKKDYTLKKNGFNHGLEIERYGDEEYVHIEGRAYFLEY